MAMAASCSRLAVRFVHCVSLLPLSVRCLIEKSIEVSRRLPTRHAAPRLIRRAAAGIITMPVHLHIGADVDLIDDLRHGDDRVGPLERLGPCGIHRAAVVGGAAPGGYERPGR